MALVRIIHPDEYESHDKRFKTSAFEPSDDGGISVVDTDCAVLASQTVCEHVVQNYPTLIAGPPPVTFYLWTVPDLPAGCGVSNPAGYQDPCHRNITGFSRGKAKSFFKREHWKENGGGRRLVGIQRCGPFRADHGI
jgi:hypothetical protein